MIAPAFCGFIFTTGQVISPIFQLKTLILRDIKQLAGSQSQGVAEPRYKPLCHAASRRCVMPPARMAKPAAFLKERSLVVKHSPQATLSLFLFATCHGAQPGTWRSPGHLLGVPCT